MVGQIGGFAQLAKRYGTDLYAPGSCSPLFQRCSLIRFNGRAINLETMKLTSIAFGIVAIGGAAGATAIAFPSTFAGALGAQHEDYIAPQAVDLNAGYVRKSISNFSIKSALLSLDRQQRDKVSGFRQRSSMIEPIEELNLLSSTTQVVDDDTVEMRVSFNGDSVATIEVHIAPITESRSTVDVIVKFDRDWLSDSGEVLPGDLARLEPIFEVLATEYVVSVLQRRPFARSDDDLAQIYGRDTLDRIEERVGRNSAATRRVKAAVAAQLRSPVGYYEASHRFQQKPGELPRRFKSVDSDRTGPRHKPGEGFREPEDDDGSNWARD